jgi:hypothetical protein
MDSEFVQTLHHILSLVGKAAEGYMKFYLKMGSGVKLVWPKVEAPREARKERLFMSFQRTTCESINKEKNLENLEHHGLDMAVQYAGLIFVRLGLVGRSILSFLSM